MSRLGHMVGSLGPYCIFKLPEGFFVRHEKLLGYSGGRMRRKWTPVNVVAVPSQGEADAIIGLALTPGGRPQ